MPLQAPILDDRTFDQLLSEAQERIVRYSRGEWTDFNDSDPGMTIVQLFAWLTETMLFRMNQIPDRNYVKFLEMLNLQLTPAEPAKAALTFVPKSDPTVEFGAIPRGTQVQSENPAGGDPLTFETTSGLSIVRRPLNAIQVFDGSAFQVIADDLADSSVGSGPEFSPFGWTPQPGSALYLGFLGLEEGQELPREARPIFPNRMTLRVVLPVKAGVRLQKYCSTEASVVQMRPRSVWEYKRSDAERHWRRLDVLKDESQDFTRDGDILIQGPGEIEATIQGRLTADDQAHYWIRCRLETADFPGGTAPLIEAVLPNTVDAVNLETVQNEITGRSEGVPEQHFRLQQRPVVVSDEVNIEELDQEFQAAHPDLRSLPSPVVEITTPAGQVEIWERRPDFLSSGADDPHYVLDPNSGTITFGDGKKGRIPVADSEIVIRHYRTGGGSAGNVPSGTIVTQRSSLPFVESVSNHRKAEGGRDAQTVEQLKQMAPAMLRCQARSVTEDDFESVARQTGGVQQARVLPLFHPDYPDVSVPGAVTVVVVADTVSVPPRPTPELLNAVCERLDRHRLITTELFVVEPDFTPVEITATVAANPSASFDRLKQQIRLALLSVFNPFSEAADEWRAQAGPASRPPDRDNVPLLPGRDLFVTKLFDVILSPGSDIISVPKLAVEIEGNVVPFDRQFAVRVDQVLFLNPDSVDITIIPAQDR